MLPDAFHGEALKHAATVDPARAQKARDWLDEQGLDHWPYDPDEFPGA